MCASEMGAAKNFITYMPVVDPSSFMWKYSLYWSMALMELKMDYAMRQNCIWMSDCSDSSTGVPVLTPSKPDAVALSAATRRIA